MAVYSWRFGGGRRSYHLRREQVAAGGADALLVGEAGGGEVVVAVVVDVVVGAGGAWLPPLPQAARIAPMAIGRRRRKLPPDADRCALGSCFNSCFYACAGTARLGCAEVEEVPGVIVSAGTIGLYDPSSTPVSGSTSPPKTVARAERPAVPPCLAYRPTS